jgi:hypothetical protein
MASQLIFVGVICQAMAFIQLFCSRLQNGISKVASFIYTRIHVIIVSSINLTSLILESVVIPAPERHSGYDSC